VQRSGPDGYGNRSGVAVNDQTAMQVAAVFRCIRIIAETAASLPLRAYAMVNQFDREPLPESHWLSSLLCEPNEEMSGDEWCESQYGQMAGWGNAYTQIVPNAAGRAVELWPYKVDYMKVTRREDRTLQYDYPDVYGTPKELGKGRVLHLRAFSLDGVMGLSPLALARESLGLAVGAQQFAGSFFSSGGRPSGIMTVDKLLNDKQREQIRKEYGGIADGGDGKRFWLLEAAMKYQPITVSPEDMQMLQTRAFEVSEIARFFGVPLFLLMETEKSTSWGSGLEQSNLAFLIYTLRPYLNRMQNTFNRRIIPPAERGKICVEVDPSPLLTADFQTLASFLSQAVQNGIMTRNQARRWLKMPADPDPAANVLMAQVNMAPLGSLGNLTAAQVDTIKHLHGMSQLSEDPRVVPIRPSVQRTGT
jgi:HK97 family phage portal protein